MQDFSTQRVVSTVGILTLVLSASSWGQVRIQDRLGFAVPRERISVLFDVTCRVVAEEFRLRDSSEVRVPTTLVLGDSRDGVVGDETNQIFTIYMSRWDEAMFATSVSRIALQHLLSQDRKAHIVSESLRRAHAISPVSVDALNVARRDARVSLPAQPCLSPSPSPFPAEREDRYRSSAFCQPAVQSAP